MEDSAADLCSRCASIPWDHLEQKERAWFWRDEKLTLGDLQTSSCRLCRLIAYTILAQPVQDAHPQSVVTMNWRQALESGDRWLGSLDLWAEPGGYVGKLLYVTRESARENATALFPEVSKRVDFAIVKQFVEACKASHKSCEPETSPQLQDLRVINCIDNAVVMAPIGCSFVALSYVWGGLSADSYVLGSQIAFPPTIEDAVRFTRELGYQYLWVDRHCIDQEDPCDKEIQISQMGRIYASAQVTIVAAAGADPLNGLVGISRDRTALSAREPIGSSRLLCLFPAADAPEYIAYSPWFSRAWTLQEGYLSKRIICFTEREVIFTCKFGSWIAESTPNRRVLLSGATRGSNDDFVKTALTSQVASLDDATDIMRVYSRRVRGHESDMLNAIVGILNVLKNGRPPVYHIWGVPFTITQRLDAAHSADSTIFISLNWYHPESARRLPEFPSWSTLGWIGQVYHRREPEVTPHFMIKYWSGERYQELDYGTCDLDYTYCRDVTHRSQYLEITTDVVQVKLSSRCSNDNVSYFQPTFIRQKEVKNQKEVWPYTDVQCPYLCVFLEDETSFDVALPVLCATTTPPEIDSYSWSSFRDKNSMLLVFQTKAKSYERVGACYPEVYTIDKKGQYTYSDHELWEFVPPGEPGAWDQVAERRTFLLG